MMRNKTVKGWRWLLAAVLFLGIGLLLYGRISEVLRGQAVKTSPFHGGNTGSIPVGVTEYKIFVMYADVAQLAEQLICNQQVIGSSPIIGSLDL